MSCCVLYKLPGFMSFNFYLILVSANFTWNYYALSAYYTAKQLTGVWEAPSAHAQVDISL